MSTAALRNAAVACGASILNRLIDETLLMCCGRIIVVGADVGLRTIYTGVNRAMTEDSQASGFWSYVHKDDEQVAGRILRLASLIRDEYALLTGTDLEIFVDRESLSWGDQWRARVNTALQETTFFIPIVTPRYFASEECRRELMKFVTHARALGAEELLLPILFVRVADLSEDSDDEAKAVIAKTQYENWTDLRLTDEQSEAYSRAVNRLATRLTEIAAAYAAQPSVDPATVGVDVSAIDDDAEDPGEPGLGDLVAQLEEVMPLWVETINSFPPILQQITAIANAGTGRFADEGSTFAKRVLLARDIGHQLMEPAEELRETGSRYASQLLEADPGVRALIALAAEQTNEDDITSACEMFAALKSLVRISKNNETTFREFITSLRGPSRTFKDLRPALGRMETGMRSVLDAQTIMDEWTRLIDESPLDCSTQPSPAPTD